MRSIGISLLAVLAFPAAAWAETHTVGPADDWFSVLGGDGLGTGDELVLTAGTYSDRRLLQISHRGTAERPVVIRGTEGAVFHRPDARQNSLNLVGAQHLIIRDLEITGGSAGIRIWKSDSHPAKAITLESLHIHHIGGVAVTCNHDGNIYEGMVFRNNHIHHTSGHGEAFYLGCNNAADGTTPGYITGALVEGNYIHHLDGEEISQGDGIEIKDGSFGNIVRHNVIHHTGYPGVIAYGTDGKAPNVIEGNLIWNTGDHGIQVASDAVIRGNIIASPGADGIRSQPHQSAEPGALVIEGNTVIGGADGSPIRISGTPDRLVTVQDNRLVPAPGHGAVRAERGRLLVVEGNAPDADGAPDFDPDRAPAWDGEGFPGSG